MNRIQKSLSARQRWMSWRQMTLMVFTLSRSIYGVSQRTHSISLILIVEHISHPLSETQAKEMLSGSANGFLIRAPRTLG